MTKVKLGTQQGIFYQALSSQALLFTEPRQPFGRCRNMSTNLKKSKTESQWSSNSFLPFFTVRMFIVAICLFFRKTKLSVLVVSHKLQTERAQMPPQFIKTKDFPSEKEKWQLLRNWIAKVRMVSCVVFPPLGVLIDLQSIADIDLFRSSSICQFNFKQTRAIMKDSNGILVHI